MNISTKEILTQARAIIAREENWLASYDAVDANGNWCDPKAPQAARWAAKATLSVVRQKNFRQDDTPEDDGRYRMARILLGPTHQKTHQEVLGLFDAAILLADPEPYPPLQFGA